MKLTKGNKENNIAKLVIRFIKFLAKENISNFGIIYKPLFIILYPIDTFIYTAFTQMWHKYFHI